jgi:APA family basic amino acid/polyamine antiporter
MVTVLTGMVPYNKINVDAPVSDAFRQAGLAWAQFVVSLGALAGMTSVLLVLMLSQPRILLAMARDGLISPRYFGGVHERYRTPWRSTLLTGIFVGTVGGLLPIRVLAELVNIGTLFAFIIVCVSVLVMRRTHSDANRPFRVPFAPFTPIFGIIACLILMFSLPVMNWLRLGIWFGIGLVIYFFYGRRHSRLTDNSNSE